MRASMLIRTDYGRKVEYEAAGALARAVIVVDESAAAAWILEAVNKTT